MFQTTWNKADQSVRNSVIVSFPIVQCMKIDWDFLSRRGNLNSCGLCLVVCEFENLHVQKPDRDCDDWEKCSLTESIVANIEEENALDPEFCNKSVWQDSTPFVSFYRNWTRYNERSIGSFDCWKYFTKVCQDHP